MASIRNAGLSSLKRTQTEARPQSVVPVEQPEESGGDDLAAALKAALNRRKGAVGESGTFSFIFINFIDSDEDSEEWDD